MISSNSSKFLEYYQLQQKTEDRAVKRCKYNNQDEDDNLRHVNSVSNIHKSVHIK